MGMNDNGQSFLNMTKAKAEAHAKAAQYWDKIAFVMNIIMIVLSAFTTLATLLPISKYVASGLGAAATLVSSVVGFLNPSLKRQQQEAASSGFRSLMMKMVRVETEREYKELWKEYGKELLGEPFLPAKYKVKADTDFTMSSEFVLLVATKEAEIRERSEVLGVNLAAISGAADDEKPPTTSEDIDKSLAIINLSFK